MSRPSIGFTVQDHSGDAMEAIQRMFSPEFRNRLDSIVQFSSLGPDTIAHVVDKFIIELEGQLEEKRVILDVDEEARAWLAEHGFDVLMGARPMARVIQEHIKLNRFTAADADLTVFAALNAARVHDVER